MRAKAEFLDHLEVAFALHACGGEHVVRDGGVCAALERLHAVIAKDLATAGEAQIRMRIDKAVNRHDAAEFVVRERSQVFERRARNCAQHVHRRRFYAKLAQIQAHVDAVFHGFAESHDAAAADFKSCCKCVLECTDFVVVGVRGAYIGEMPAVRFEIVVETREACLLELVELFAFQKPC